MIGKPTRGKAVDKATVIELYKKGFSMAEIGRQLGHHHGVISYHIHKSSVPLHNPRNQQCPVSTNYIRKLYEQGMSTVEIGENVNLTPQSIYSRLLKSGVKLRSFSEAIKLAGLRGRKKYQLGKANAQWKGGKYKDKDGYISHNIDGRQLFEHRLIWENEHGEIPKGFIIHHLNGIRDDNRIENLAAMSRKRHSPTLIIKPHQLRIRQLEKELKIKRRNYGPKQ